MRSIFEMPSADLAGDAKRSVPLPLRKEEGKCELTRRKANVLVSGRGGSLSGSSLKI